MNQQAEKMRELRTVILDAAVIVFARKGYREATIQDVALSIHVPASILYYYFRNKRALYEAVILRYLKERREDYERIDMESASFSEMIREHLQRCIRVADESFLLDRLRSADTEFRELAEYNELTDIYLWHMKKNFIIRAVEAGELRPDLNVEELVDFLYLQFYGLLRVAQDMSLDATLKQIDCVANMLVNMDIWGPKAEEYKVSLLASQRDVWKNDRG